MFNVKQSEGFSEVYFRVILGVRIGKNRAFWDKSEQRGVTERLGRK